MTQTEEKYLWENATIVFDTSALGDSYAISFSAQQHFVEILKYLKERIWIPAHVKLEFEVHHIKFLHSAMPDRYKSEDKIDRLWKLYCEELSNLTSTLTIGEEMHPYFDSKALSDLNDAIDNQKDNYSKINSIIKDQYQARREEIEKAAKEDKLYEVYKIFKKGDAFSIDELIALAKEGEIRYKRLIPPGYMDSKEKHGIQKFGDLIVWKEMMRYAKSQSQDVILISDDVKEDWNTDPEDVSKGPRMELVKEFQNETGHRFWKYTLAQMIEKLELYYAEDKSLLPLFGHLEKVHYQMQLKEIMRRHKERMDNLTVLKCSYCGHVFVVGKDELYLEWEPDGSSERPMGVEHEYVATDAVMCPHCENQVDLEFHIWEYPIGAFNYQQIDAHGANVIKEMDLSEEVDFFDDDLDYCESCGEYKHINPENGMCDDCYDREWEEMMNE